MIYDSLIDTDVIIWYLKGNQKAFDIINKGSFYISSITYIELIQGIKNKDELRKLQKALKIWDAKILYINEEIASRAVFLVQEYFLSHSMQLADAHIGATCLNQGLKLITANDKHYKFIKDLEIEIFRP